MSFVGTFRVAFGCGSCKEVQVTAKAKAGLILGAKRRTGAMFITRAARGYGDRYMQQLSGLHCSNFVEKPTALWGSKASVSLSGSHSNARRLVKTLVWLSCYEAMIL